MWEPASASGQLWLIPKMPTSWSCVTHALRMSLVFLVLQTKEGKETSKLGEEGRERGQGKGSSEDNHGLQTLRSLLHSL